jgi:hypothetical protein
VVAVVANNSQWCRFLIEHLGYSNIMASLSWDLAAAYGHMLINQHVTKM